MTICLNLLIVIVVIAWLCSQQQRLDGEWQWRPWMACLYVDHNGYYVSVLPSQDNISITYAAIVQLLPNPPIEPTPIESNLALEKRSLLLPGIAFWWSTKPTDPFDRIVVRARHGFLLGFAIMIRWLLYRFFRKLLVQSRPELSEQIPAP